MSEDKPVRTGPEGRKKKRKGPAQSGRLTDGNHATMWRHVPLNETKKWDLRWADPSCKKGCNGTGSAGTLINYNGKLRMPLLCACVVKNATEGKAKGFTDPLSWWTSKRGRRSVAS